MNEAQIVAAALGVFWASIIIIAAKEFWRTGGRK